LTVLISSVFAQWHLKSVRLEQPSALRAVTKQLRAHDGIASSWAVATEARAKAKTANEVFMVMIVWD